MISHIKQIKLLCIFCIGILNLYSMEAKKTYYSAADVWDDTGEDDFYARPGKYDESNIQQTKSEPVSPNESSSDDESQESHPRAKRLEQTKDDTRLLSGGLTVQVNKQLLQNLDNLNAQLYAALFPTNQRPDLKKASALIRTGADVNAVNQSGDPLIFEAIAKQDAAVLKFLVEKGANINKKNAKGVTALNKAVIDAVTARGKKAGMGRIRFLIEKGADPNIADENGITPLHYVAYIGDQAIAEQIARLLINAGAKVLSRDSKNRTVIDAAKGLRDKEAIVKYLERKSREQEVVVRNKKKKEDEESRLVY